MSIDFLYAALGVAGVAVGGRFVQFLVRLGRHLAWRLERRRDRNGRRGDVLEALARRAEGGSPWG